MFKQFQINKALSKELEELKLAYETLNSQQKQNIMEDKQLYFNFALNEIADVIISNNNSEEILRKTNRILSETMKVDRSVIYNISFEKNKLTGLIEWIKPNHPDIIKTLGEYPLDLFLAPAEAIRKSETYIESHINAINKNFNPKLANLLHEQLKIKSLIWYPFAFNEFGFHVFAMNQILEDRAWTKEDIGFIESAAKQVSLALIKIQLRDSEEKYRQLFEALEQSSKKWEAIISASPDGIGMITIDGRIQLISEKLVKMHGYPVELMHTYIGRSVFDFIDPDDHQLLIDNTRKLLAGEKKDNITEYRALKKDKSQFYIDINTSVLFDSEGNPASILYVERDITERKMVENEIKISNQELKKVNAEKDKFFSIIAHDLKSPFFSLLGLTEILATESQDMSRDEIKNFSLSLQGSVGTLYKLLDNLLELGQLQKGMISFNPKILSLFQVFVQSTNQIEKIAMQKEITIINEIPENQEIYADETMICSVLRNLLTNSVKYTNKGGRVVAKVSKTEDGLVEISVNDNGIGISEDIISKLFRIDEKVNTIGTDGEPSTGLGLILCKEFVEKHNGKIWVESKLGTGSSFYFTIPNKIF